MYHYLVYVSSASYPFAENDLTKILEKSRENNLMRKLTGLLIYVDGNIIQILEGEKETVQKVFQKISADPMHRGLIKIKEGSQKTRIFPEWSMGFKTVSKNDLGKMLGYKSLTDFQVDPESKEKHPALLLLNSFMKTSKIF